MNKYNKKTTVYNPSTMVINSLFTTFTILVLLAPSFLPLADLTAYLLAGVFTSFVIINSGPKSAILFYFSVILLTFILIPNKISLIPYALFFGIYGFIKYYSELNKNIIVQYAVKIASYVVLSLVILFFLKTIILQNYKFETLTLTLIYLASILIFLLYDFIYTQILIIYIQKFKPKNNDKPINFNLSKKEKSQDEENRHN
ncbi:MAG: hypothetical protein PUI85_04425 [Eubacteriales bacterium]|nr:hypothetical protein [Eubacteriales bacterium]MDY3332395.1 hypothetical protein [Gallibacter sp.]